jgi:hypothetical protein
MKIPIRDTPLSITTLISDQCTRSRKTHNPSCMKRSTINLSYYIRIYAKSRYIALERPGLQYGHPYYYAGAAAKPIHARPMQPQAATQMLPGGVNRRGPTLSSCHEFNRAVATTALTTLRIYICEQLCSWCERAHNVCVRTCML